MHGINMVDVCYCVFQLVSSEHTRILCKGKFVSLHKGLSKHDNFILCFIALSLDGYFPFNSFVSVLCANSVYGRQ